MPDPGAALIWCPFGDGASAEAVAVALLDEGVVACANIVPSVRSLYRWQGKRGETVEVGVLFKTTAAGLHRAVERLETLHPYDAPAITAWCCDAAGSATLDWLGEEIR